MTALPILLSLSSTNQSSSSSVRVWSRAVRSSFSSSLGFWDETSRLVLFSLQLLSLATFVWRRLIGQYCCLLLAVWWILCHQCVRGCHHTPWTCSNPVSSHSGHFLEDMTMSPELSSVESTFFLSSAETYLSLKRPSWIWRLARQTRDASEGHPSQCSRFYIPGQPVLSIV